jgi:flagellar biosynthesis GTPase FlhF
MTQKLSLYEILDIPQTADSAAIDRAWTIKLNALELAAVAGIDAADLASRKQIIRFAASTLLDSSTRLAYDAELARNNNIGLAGQHTSSHLLPDNSAQNAGKTANDLALVPQVTSSATRDSMNLRADALALRAEAMSLRADALILQSGAALPSSGHSGSSGGWLRLISSGPIWRIMIFLTVMGLVALTLARCTTEAPMRRDAAESKAGEKAALQEYFQTHGVRPANLAEMELLDAERRRRSNESRNEQQNADQKVKEEVKFEEDSRKRAQEVSERLRFEETQQKLAAQREERDAERERTERKEADRIAEEQRIQKMQNQWQQIIKR